MNVVGFGPSQPTSETALATSVRRLSSGLRVASAADDPSGLAIATNLATQTQGFDRGRRNVTDATNALAVADRALSTVSNLLQRIRALTVEGRSDLISTSDRAGVNEEIATLTREIDATARSATFNGVALFPIAPPTAARVGTVKRDDALANGKPLVDPSSLYVDTTNGANLDFTVSIVAYDAASQSVTVKFDASSPSATQSFDNTFPQSRALPTAQPMSTWWIDDATHADRLVTLTMNQVSAADVGKAFEVTTGKSTASTLSLSIATGEREGRSVDVSTAALSSASLMVQDVTIGGDDAANQSVQQSVDDAITAVASMRATVGAQTVVLGEESANAETASLDLTTAQSAIADLDVGAESSSYARLRMLQALRSGLRDYLRRDALALTGTLLDALR